MIYKIATPITFEELQSTLPHYEPIPIWWDNECYLMYWNVWNKIYYMSPNGQGELRNNKWTMFYDRKLKPEYIVEKRDYWKFLRESRSSYHCPNCDRDLVPYDYNYKDVFLTGQRRQKFCSKCGYPILWY
jgi:hypothetical protein